MRKAFNVLILLAFAGMAFGTVIDDYLQVPTAVDAPVIDGELDDNWKNVTDTRMDVFEDGSVEPETLDDHYSSFRVMWDEDNFYLFVTVIDDTLNADASFDPWFRDCIELFIDGDNSKNDASLGYDDNDVQWRWVYGQEPDGVVNAERGPGVWAFTDTEVGFNFELAIPADSLTFDLEDGTEIGFDIGMRDLDSEANMVRRWWSNDGLAWNTPAVFGNAVLTGREITEVMDIHMAFDEPDIDGEMSEGELWDEIPEFSRNVFEGNVLPDTALETSMDHWFSFYPAWDEDNFYLFVKVIDDAKDAPASLDPWFRDCIELFIDGDNSKNDASLGYDANDVQWRWVYGQEPDGVVNAEKGPGTWAFKDTEDGFNFELKIPADSLTFDLEDGTEIGFDLGMRDLDGDDFNVVGRWWASDGLAWNTPAVFGTAELVGETGSSIRIARTGLVESYELKQNYPNPFNPATTIDFAVHVTGQVKLAVYDVMGHQVATLVNDVLVAGSYSAAFNASALTSGVYFYKLETGRTTITKKMMLMK